MQKILEIQDLNVYYGDNHVLKNINLTINENDYLCIIGPNGGGKTTFLKSILGIVPKSSGSILINNLIIDNIGYVPSIASFNRDFPITVKEAIMMGKIIKQIKPFFNYKNVSDSEINDLLELLELKHLKDNLISKLSSGEFQKMLIARTLIAKPKLLLLDEPTANIDIASKEKIYSLLAKLNKEMTIVLVTHDMLAISSSITKVACINNDLIYHGNPELTIDVVNRLYGCNVDLIAHGIPHRVLGEHHHE